jgi:hypothetical protein
VFQNSKLVKYLEPITGKELLNKLIVIAFIMGTIGIAMKFVTTMIQCELYGMYVFFPFFPNILDSTFLIIGVIYLGIKAFKNKKN